MQNKYMLSICIPTYNRKTFLAKLLDNLLLQLTQLDNQVEICVSDNSSDDGTDELLKKICAFENVSVTTNRNNYGYDYNVINAINVAKGKYIWFLSDDDDISDCAISEVLRIIEENPKCNAIFIKPIFYKGECKKSRGGVFYELEKSGTIALNRIGWHVSFISSFIIANIMEGRNYNNYIGLGFMHVPFVLDHVRYGNVIIVNEGLLYSLQGNSGGYDKYKYFCQNFDYILRSYTNEYGDQNINYVLLDWVKSIVLGNVYADKLEKKFTLENARELLNTYFGLKGIKLRLLFTVCCPAKMAPYITKVISFILNKERRSS